MAFEEGRRGDFPQDRGDRRDRRRFGEQRAEARGYRPAKGEWDRERDRDRGRDRDRDGERHRERDRDREWRNDRGQPSRDRGPPPPPTVKNPLLAEVVKAAKERAAQQGGGTPARSQSPMSWRGSQQRSRSRSRQRERSQSRESGEIDSSPRRSPRRSPSPSAASKAPERPLSQAERIRAEAEAFRSRLVADGGADLGGGRDSRGPGRAAPLWHDEEDMSQDGSQAGGEPVERGDEGAGEVAEAGAGEGEGDEELGDARAAGADEAGAKAENGEARGAADGAGSDADDGLGDVSIWNECRSVEEFEKLNMVDEGTFGTVFRARDSQTDRIYALKQVKMHREREGFPQTSVREFNLLLALRHPNVVGVREVVVGSKIDKIYMVMEFMDHDLKTLMEEMPQPFQLSEIKQLMVQLLRGIEYLHDNWVMHRDLKPHNILFSNTGLLKICDFGMARQFSSDAKADYTPGVCTAWYRAPEIMLGASKYGPASDMWSCGCIMAELMLHETLFNGQSELDMLTQFCDLLGAPTEQIWPGFRSLPGSREVSWSRCNPRSRLAERFSHAAGIGVTSYPTMTEAGLDLLSRLLAWDPSSRLTATEALAHPWFREMPLPKSRSDMPRFKSVKDQDGRTRERIHDPTLRKLKHAGAL